MWPVIIAAIGLDNEREKRAELQLGVRTTCEIEADVEKAGGVGSRSDGGDRN